MGRKPGVPRVRLDSDHGDVYQFDFKWQRKRHRGSTGLTDPSAAQRWLDDYHAKVVLGRPAVRPSPTRVQIAPPDALAKLIDAYSTHLDALVARGKLAASYTRKIKQHLHLHFEARFATIFDMLEPGAIDAWTTERLASPTLFREYERDGRVIASRSNKPTPASNTVHKELVSLRRFLVWAKEQGHIREVPAFESVDQTSHYTPPDYSPEDVAALIAEIPDRHAHKKRMPAREYFTVLWAQALRSDAECGTLRWCDVNMRRKEVTIRAGVSKNGEARTIAMAHETYAVLSEMHKEAQAQGPVLATSLIFGRHNFLRSLQTTAARLELPALTRHSLRHFRLTELGNSPGTAVAALQYFAGHKRLATTDKYVRSRTKATADMLAKLVK
jgi:integrase